MNSLGVMRATAANRQGIFRTIGSFVLRADVAPVTRFRRVNGQTEPSKVMRITAIVLLLFVTLAACDSGGSNDSSPDTKETTTVLTSSSLAPALAAPKAVLRRRGGSKSATDIEVTPSNVTGEVMSVLFTVQPAVDEGIVVFGDGRPDIAPTSVQLFPFDFASQLVVNSTFELKPGFQGGTSQNVLTLFGWSDFDYTQLDGTERTVRVAMASVDGMTRGDKLLAVGSGFQWFDLDTNTFTSTRPSNPATIVEIRDFTDPIRPNLVFFPLVVDLTSVIPVDAATFQASSTIEAEVDFLMSGAITLVGQNTSDISAEVLIQVFTLTQILNGGGAAGLNADATLVALP
jgi:hypothetical protein